MGESTEMVVSVAWLQSLLAEINSLKAWEEELTQRLGTASPSPSFSTSSSPSPTAVPPTVRIRIYGSGGATGPFTVSNLAFNGASVLSFVMECFNPPACTADNTRISLTKNGLQVNVDYVLTDWPTSISFSYSGSSTIGYNPEIYKVFSSRSLMVYDQRAEQFDDLDGDGVPEKTGVTCQPYSLAYFDSWSVSNTCPFPQ